MKKNLSMIAIIIAAVIVVLSVVIGTRFATVPAGSYISA